MATILKHPSHHHISLHRTPVQRICIGLGTAFVMLGFIGLLMPSFMGLHLSFAHIFFIFASSALSFWCGYGESSTRSYNFCLGGGAIFGMVGIIGFIVGEPGYPSVGRMEADQYLLRYIPNVLELGSHDHILYMIIGMFLIYSAYTWRRQFRSSGMRIVRTQSRADIIRQVK